MKIVVWLIVVLGGAFVGLLLAEVLKGIAQLLP